MTVYIIYVRLRLYCEILMTCITNKAVIHLDSSPFLRPRDI